MENGNIKNSVNYPACDAGVCETEGRVTICHKNVPDMIHKFTAIFGAAGINIENMINKSRGDYAYSVFDITSKVTDEVVENLAKIDGALKVRVVK